MRIGVSYMCYGGKGGAENVLNIVSKYILDINKEMEFVVYVNSKGKKYFTTRSERIIIKEISECNNRIKKLLWHEFFLPKIVSKDKLDVLFITSGANTFPCKAKCPSVVMVHDLGEYHVKYKYDIIRLFYRKKICIPLSIKRANRIIAVSENTKKDLIKILGVPKSKITVIHHGSTSFGINTIPDSREQVREKMGLSNLPFLFYPCRTDYVGKGLDLLLKAYKIIIKNRPDFPLLVITGAKGVGHDTFIAKISQLGLEKKVLWLGWIDLSELETLYREATLLVFPSRYEGFGFPLTEAMERGLPVACSNRSSLPEIGGDAVAYFNPDDPENMANVILYLIDNGNILQQMREKGFKQVKKFSWEESARKLLNIFNELAVK